MANYIAVVHKDPKSDFGVSFPKPLCTTELDVFRIDSRDFIQSLKQPSPQSTVLNTKTNVGDPVLHSDNGICNWQGLQVHLHAIAIP